MDCHDPWPGIPVRAAGGGKPVNRSAPGTLLRILLPALAGVAVGVVLQLTEPRVRLYAAMAPALLALILGVAGTAALIVGVVVKQRIATAVAAAEAAASG